MNSVFKKWIKVDGDADLSFALIRDEAYIVSISKEEVVTPSDLKVSDFIRGLQDQEQSEFFMIVALYTREKE